MTHALTVAQKVTRQLLQCSGVIYDLCPISIWLLGQGAVFYRLGWGWRVTRQAISKRPHDRLLLASAVNKFIHESLVAGFYSENTGLCPTFGKRRLEIAQR